MCSILEISLNQFTIWIMQLIVNCSWAWQNCVRHVHYESYFGRKTRNSSQRNRYKIRALQDNNKFPPTESIYKKTGFCWIFLFFILRRLLLFIFRPVNPSVVIEFSWCDARLINSNVARDIDSGANIQFNDMQTFLFLSLSAPIATRGCN